MRDPARPLRKAGKNPLHRQLLQMRIAELRSRIASGGLREGLVRSALFIGMARGSVDERVFELVRRMRLTADGMPRLTLQAFKALVREQYFMLLIDEAAALAAIPSLLPSGAKIGARHLRSCVRSSPPAASCPEKPPGGWNELPGCSKPMPSRSNPSERAHAATGTGRRPGARHHRPAAAAAESKCRHRQPRGHTDGSHQDQSATPGVRLKIRPAHRQGQGGAAGYDDCGAPVRRDLVARRYRGSADRHHRSDPGRASRTNQAHGSASTRSTSGDAKSSIRLTATPRRPNPSN